MSDWVKTLTVSICILTILMHLVPNGKFEKYVRFYVGFLFFLLAAKPVLNLFGKSGELERLLQLEFLKEEYYDMETAVEGMAELKNEEIRSCYQQEILRQIREISLAYGLEANTVDAKFGEEDGYRLTEISIEVNSEDEEPQKLEAVKKELAEVYSLAVKQIRINS